MSLPDTNEPKAAAPLYADVALPLAVDELFTYSLPEELRAARPGMRAWVPLKGRMSIGMIVKIHSDRPEFETRMVRRLLDDEPVMSSEMLALTGWMSRFYVCGQGEVIQAALPSGLNFSSVTYLRALPLPEEPSVVSLTPAQHTFYEAVSGSDAITLKEANRRWDNAGRLISALRTKNLLELWDQPQLDMRPRTETVWCWAGEEKGAKLSEQESGKNTKWRQALDYLRENDLLPATSASLGEQNPLLTGWSLGRLEKEGILRKEEREVNAAEPDYPYQPESLSKLNGNQLKATGRIKQTLDTGSYHKFLLYGITGSGKTEVYIHALQHAVSAGKGALVLVPEIALTPQTVRRFYRVFGRRIAVLHSRLTERERFDAWQALRKGEKDIVIGARSAVFAPLKNPGIIIIDEEHDTSYYQADPAPRYHAREVAAVRASRAGAVLVLGSATPSLVSLTETTKGKSTLLKLGERHSGAVLPEVKVLSLSEYRNAMKGPLAVPLYDAVQERVGRGEQAILLYNRRGFASYMQCETCGEVCECPHCSVSLTYHRRQDHLRCHYCGYSTKVPEACPDCGSAGLSMQGSGTQQIEEELSGLFPDFRVLRMDQDTTSGKNAHDRILSAFGRKEADILIGTQLVAKGLDFPDVTLVGVVNADTELAFPSYRSNERMFQLLSQVAGRSGRAAKSGMVYLQTRQPDHFAIKYACNHDFEGFARAEMALRKPLLYPPYARLMQIAFRGRNATACRQAAEQYTRVIEQSETGFPVLGPAPDIIEKVKDEYRWLTILKLPADISTTRLERMCAHFARWYEKTRPEGATTVRVTISHEML